MDKESELEMLKGVLSNLHKLIAQQEATIKKQSEMIDLLCKIPK